MRKNTSKSNQVNNNTETSSTANDLGSSLSILSSMLKGLGGNNFGALADQLKKTMKTDSEKTTTNNNVNNNNNDNSSVNAEDVMNHMSDLMGGHKLSNFGMNAMKNHQNQINNLCQEFLDETENTKNQEDENEEKYQRDPQMIYELFNKQITERFIPLLIRELPHDSVHYKSLVLPAVQNQIIKDIKIPMKKWTKTTEKHKKCLQSLTKENVTYFVEHVESIEILNDLKIAQNWDLFSKKPTNIQELWAIFSELLRLESLVDIISPNLLSALESTVKTITEKGDLVRTLHKNGDTQQLYNVALNSIMGDKGVLDEIKKYTKLVEKNLSGTGSPLPPSQQELQKLESKKNEELND
jgi:uncharacterized protein YukE